MGKELEASDNGQALTGFRELLDDRNALAKEALSLFRKTRAGDSSAAAELAKAEQRLSMIDIWIAEARVTLRNHDVDQATIDGALRTSQQQSVGFELIRELEGGS